jgi:hypothetical protein
MHRRNRFLHFLFLALMASVLACVSLYAQADTGSIQGTIKDQSGAVFPKA